MGATAALEFAIRHPGKGLSITAAGAGSGATRDPEERKRFAAEAVGVAELVETKGMPALGERYLNAPSRQQLKIKDPRGFAEFYKPVRRGRIGGPRADDAGHPGATRSDVRARGRAARHLGPVLIVCGDEDDATLDVSLFMKRTIPRCGLMVFPRTGHGINLEEPAGFNAVVQDFIHAVEHGRWGESVSTHGKGFAMLPQS